jgi:hypothetical protein
MENTKKAAVAAFAALFALALATAPVLADTQAYARPGYLDAVLSSPVSGTIHIETDKPGLYKIAITGVPDDWIEYPASVRVDEGKDGIVTFVVNPKATGKYTLFVTVKGPGGTLDLEERLWVGTAGSSGSAYYGSGSPQGPAPSGPSSAGGLTGMFTLTPQDATIAIYAVTILTAIFVLLAGHLTLKKDTEPQAGRGGEGLY